MCGDRDQLVCTVGVCVMIGINWSVLLVCVCDDRDQLVCTVVVCMW